MVSNCTESSRSLNCSADGRIRTPGLFPAGFNS